MCFSATADFAGSAVLGAVGVATLREVKKRRELLLAAMPCLFAVHEFIEGFVWLGLDGRLSPQVAHNAGAAYVLYAQGLLPFLLPFSVFLIEPTKRQRRRMMAFVILGGVLALYLTWGLVAYPTAISMQAHSILYVNVITTTTLVAMLYVIATCGSLFFSGFRALVALGWANLIGLLVVMLVKRYAFTSVWCAYAAVVSVIIYFFFRRSGEHRLASYAMAGLNGAGEDQGGCGSIAPRFITSQMLRRRSRGEDGAGGAGVVVVLRAEGLAHELLLLEALDGEGEPEEEDGGDVAPLVPGERGANQRDDHAGIDGVAHEAVGTGADELVADLDGDGAGPVAAQRGASPEGEGEAECGDGDAEPAEPVAVGKDIAGPEAAKMFGEEDEVECGPDGDGVGHARTETLALAGLLGLKGPEEPDDDPAGPEVAADMGG